MHGEGVNAVVAGSYLGSAIALVDIAVDDENPAQAAFGLHGPGCDDNIIVEAKTLTVIPASVVGTAAKVHPHAVSQGDSGCRDGAAGHVADTSYELWRPGQPDSPYLFRRQ
jgi:hypothetical protein